MNSHQRRIYEHIVNMISSGELALGEKLPTENELGGMFNTSRLNAHYAVKSLEECGLVARNKRGGSVIKAKPSDFTIGQLKSVTASRVCVLNMYPATLSGIHWNERLLAPLESALRGNGLELVYRNIHGLNDLSECRKLLSELVAGGCKALLLIADGSGEGIPFDYPELLSEFHDRIFIYDPGQSVWNNFPYNTVSLNLFGEGACAAEHLIARHAARHLVVFKTGGPYRYWFEQRYKGVCCAVKRLMPDAPAPEIIPLASFGLAQMKMIAPIPGLGMIAANDEAGSVIFDMAAKAGLRFGEGGLKLVSFDDNAQYRDRGLTTVAPAYEKIGARLAQLLLSDIESSQEIACVKINSKLIVRQTA